MTDEPSRIRRFPEDLEDEATHTFSHYRVADSSAGPSVGVPQSIRISIQPDGLTDQPPARHIEEQPLPGRSPQDPAFTLLRIVGKGGMGEVWQALQTSLGRMVAIKRIGGDPDSTGLEKWRRLANDFTCEAIVAGRLEHPNIVPVHDLCADEDGNPLLAMKLVEGRTWDDMLAEDFPDMPVSEFLARHIPILMGMVQAVAFAHSRGVVHRDLKPAQVMVGEYGEVLLSDWGLAVLTKQADTRLSNLSGLPTTDSATSPSGTPALMAPEQTKDTATNIGTWTDVYLIGGTLYHLLTGTYPHQAQTARMSITRAAAGIIVPPEDRTEGREMPPELVDLVLRCLAFDPANRPESANVVLHALRDFLSGTGRRRESSTLTDVITERASASHQSSYESLESTWATLARAGELWPGNPALPSLREGTLQEYSNLALKAGDLKLARLQANRLAPGEKRVELLDAIEAEETRIAAEVRTRRVFKTGLAAAVLVIIVGGLAFTISLSREQARTRKALAEADDMIGFMVNDLGNKLHTIGRLEIMDEAMEKADLIIKTRDPELLGETDSVHRVNLKVQFAAIRTDQGRQPEAEELLKEALALAQDAVKEKPSYSTRSTLATAWLQLGATTFDLGRMEEARDALEEALRLHEQLVAEKPDDLDMKGYLSDCWNRLGSVQSTMGEQEDAKNSFTKALRINEDLMERDPSNARWKECVAGAWAQLALVYRTQGNLAESKAAQEKRIEFYRQLAESEPKNVAYQGDFAKGHVALSAILQAEGKLEEARRVLDIGLAVRERIAAGDPTNAMARRDVAFTCSRIGGVLEKQGRFDEALAFFQRSYEIDRELAKEPDAHERQREFAVITGRIGDMHEAKGDDAAALAAYRESQEIMQQLVSIDASNGDWQRELGLTWQKIADSLGRQGQEDGAIEASAKSVEIAEALAAKDQTNVGWQHDLRGAIRLSATLNEKLGRFDEAMALIGRALDVSREIVSENPDDTDQQMELAVTLGEMGGMLKAQKRLEEARIAYAEATDILSKLQQGDPTNAGLKSNSAVCMMDIGDILAHQKKFEESLDMLARCRTLCEELVALAPDSASRQQLLAETYKRLGNLAELQDNRAAALENWNTGLAILDKAAGKVPDNVSVQEDIRQLKEVIEKTKG